MPQENEQQDTAPSLCRVLLKGRACLSIFFLCMSWKTFLCSSTTPMLVMKTENTAWEKSLRRIGPSVRILKQQRRVCREPNKVNLYILFSLSIYFISSKIHRSERRNKFYVYVCKRNPWNVLLFLTERKYLFTWDLLSVLVKYEFNLLRTKKISSLRLRHSSSCQKDR